MKFILKRLGLFAILFFSLIVMSTADKSGKYSKKANVKESEKYDSDFRWVKQRLNEICNRNSSMWSSYDSYLFILFWL